MGAAAGLGVWMSKHAGSFFERFVARLFERLKETPASQGITCPVCSQTKWTAIGGEASTDHKPWADSRRFPGRFRTIPIVCSRCGFVAHFASASYEDDSEDTLDLDRG